jgi:hypothetical protein
MRAALRLPAALVVVCLGPLGAARAQDVSMPPPPVLSTNESDSPEADVVDDGDAIVIVAPESSSVYDVPVYYENETFLKNVPLQTQITIDEAMDVPGVMGDPVKVVAFLPGVVSTGFGLFVHGSKESESAVTVNHMPIGYLFHMGALHSVMSPEAIDQFDAYLGGFDVTYGDAIGGVLDITPRYPDGSDTGYVHIGLLDSSLGCDVGLTDNLAFSLHARRSYIDLLIPVDAFSDDESGTRITTFPNYYDVNAILHYREGNHNVSLEYLLARDGFGFESKDNAVTDPAATGGIDGDLGFSSVGVRWRYAEGAYRANTLVSHLQTEQSMQIFDGFFIDMSAYTDTLYHISTYRAGPHEWALGGEVAYTHLPLDARLPLLPDADETDPDVTSAPVFDLHETLDITVYGLFIQDTISIGESLRARLGMRVEDSDFGEYEPLAMPRGAVVYDATERDTLSVSSGLYSTRPEGGKLLDQIGNPDLTDEMAVHYSASWTRRIDDWGTVTCEPYYKTLYDLALSHPDDRYRNEGEGYAYGISLSTKLRRERWYLSASYAWQEAERQLSCENPELYSFYGDVTHTAQLGVSFQFAPQWSAAFLAKYATGQPYTPIIGTYTYPDADGSLRLRPIYGIPYSERLPDYFMVNGRVAYNVSWSGGRSMELAFEVINLTNHANVMGIEYDDEYNEVGDQVGMPFLPTVNLTYRF